MDLQEFFNGRASLDFDAIRAWYAEAPDWDCACAGCRNFLALAKARRLPDEALTLLEALGIRPEQATYVCNYPSMDGGVQCQFCYRLTGTLLSTEPFRFRLSHGWNEPVPGFPEPYVDLEFWETLPWTLDEPMPASLQAAP